MKIVFGGRNITWRIACSLNFLLLFSIESGMIENLIKFNCYYDCPSAHFVEKCFKWNADSLVFTTLQCKLNSYWHYGNVWKWLEIESKSKINTRCGVITILSFFCAHESERKRNNSVAWQSYQFENNGLCYGFNIDVSLWCQTFRLNSVNGIPVV